jgi:hypothetical protein
MLPLLHLLLHLLLLLLHFLLRLLVKMLFLLVFPLPLSLSISICSQVLKYGGWSWDPLSIFSAAKGVFFTKKS